MKLKKENPNTATIVLQYEFLDLSVSNNFFSVILNIDGDGVLISVPFNAIRKFADPFAKISYEFESKLEETQDDNKDNVISFDSFKKK